MLFIEEDLLNGKDVIPPAKIIILSFAAVIERTRDKNRFLTSVSIMCMYVAYIRPNISSFSQELKRVCT